MAIPFKEHNLHSTLVSLVHKAWVCLKEDNINKPLSVNCDAFKNI